MMLFPIKNPVLAQLFRIHRSAINETPEFNESNERLEFLGDAVLELAVSNYLFGALPQEAEGMLTALRSAMVKTQTLATLARQCEIGNLLYMSKGEEKSGGRENESILADTFEAYLGALYLDQGYEIVEKFLSINLFPLLEEIQQKQLHKDYKSLLQEQLQSAHQSPPIYSVINEEGPDHHKTFTVAVQINHQLVAEARGRTKHEAQEAAAKTALERMKKT